MKAPTIRETSEGLCISQLGKMSSDFLGPLVGCFVYGDEILPSYVEIIISHYNVKNQPV